MGGIIKGNMKNKGSAQNSSRSAKQDYTDFHEE